MIDSCFKLRNKECDSFDYFDSKTYQNPSYQAVDLNLDFFCALCFQRLHRCFGRADLFRQGSGHPGVRWRGITPKDPPSIDWRVPRLHHPQCEIESSECWSLVRLRVGRVDEGQLHPGRQYHGLRRPTVKRTPRSRRTRSAVGFARCRNCGVRARSAPSASA